MAKVGLVFSGGGGKGAYEIGVWKALREYEFDRNIQAVAGTSVGGLNSALFVQGDYNKAERLWLDIAPQKILPLNKKELAKTLATVAGSFLLPGVPAKVLLGSTRLTEGKGIFDQSGLADLIEASEACNEISPKALPFHVCALNRLQGKLEYPQLNSKTPEECAKWLLASAAIPVIFDAVIIDGNSYYDGGVLPGKYSDNAPFKPLIEIHGCTHIINIYLDRNPELLTHQRSYQNVNFWNIVPTEESAGIIASLNFTAENAAKLIECGYKDVRKVLEQFKAFIDDEERYRNAVFALANSADKFKEQIDFSRQIRGESAEAGKASAISYDEVQQQLAMTLHEQERLLINSQMDEFLADTQLTSDELLEAAFTSISTLASTEGRIKHQVDQGGFSRFWGQLTGSNAKLQAGINWDLNRCIYANQQMIQKLNHKQMLSMEAIAALSNKTTYLLTHVNHVGSGLKSLEQKTLTSFKLMQQGVEALAFQSDQRFKAMEGRFENLERARLIDDWYHQAKQLAKASPLAERLVELTSSFYNYTSGQWSQAELLRYVNVLDEQGLSTEPLALSDLLEPVNARLLIEKIGPDRLLPASPFHALLKGMQMVCEEPDTKAVNCQIEQQLNLSSMRQCEARPLGLELLHSLHCNDLERHSAKSGLLETLNRLQQINQELDVYPEIVNDLQFLKSRISDFKVVVPVVGKFSGGKSTLLNRYLGKDYLKTGLTPETAFATELSYCNEEYLLVNYLNGRPAERQPLSALNDLRPVPELYYVQAFINSAKLKNRPNLILVDMPGFDSKFPGHAKAIACYLGRGDRFVSLMPADIPFDASVIERLSEIKWEYGKEIVPLISKASRKTPQALEEQKQNLAKTLADALEDCPKVGHVESVGTQVTLMDFEYAVDGAVRSYDALLLERYKPQVDNCRALLQESLVTKISYTESDGPELELKLANAKKAFKQVEKDLELSLSELEYNLCARGKEQLIQRAGASLSGAIERLINAAKTNNLEGTINDLLRPVVQGGIEQLIQTELQRLETKLDNISGQTRGDIRVVIQIPPQARELFSTSSSTITAGIGGLIFGPLIAMITGLLSSIFGLKSEAEERERLLEEQIRNAVIPQATSQVIEQVGTELERSAQTLRQHVLNAFAQQKAQHEQTVQKLKRQMQEGQQHHEELLGRYKQAMKEIDAMESGHA
ncbi:patatin-like phospholipase family protein [Marinobacter sp. ANT_B65]|uniref:patatin-like phospholipase family protein n=1 Tax=Marinobacter sp. ANT_B65 TaxID=2039467 RepID=UPI000BBEC23E|nr:patatin-like phospholipase family protein [Marinobacter sp. ANT_B65]PCM45931.1 hypothetical protein CPA50_08225 [Marinobacter sp. ANT_B65]